MDKPKAIEQCDEIIYIHCKNIFVSTRPSVCLSVWLLFVNWYTCTCVQNTRALTDINIGRPTDDSRQGDLVNDRSPPVNIPLKKWYPIYLRFQRFHNEYLCRNCILLHIPVSKMESLNQNEMDRNSKESSVLKLREFMTVEDRNLSYVTFSEVQWTANRRRHRVSTFQSRTS